jgi:hypothetical protein
MQPIEIASGVQAEPTARGVVIRRQVSCDTTEIIASITWEQLQSLHAMAPKAEARDDI